MIGMSHGQRQVAASFLGLLVLLVVSVLPVPADENKPDVTKGEGVYNFTGGFQLRVFNVDVHNLTNEDEPTTIEGHVRNVNTCNATSITV
jgi:hypothetical protein